MNTQSFNDLREFHGFVAEKLRNGRTSQSPEEVLDEWRSLHPDPGEAESDLEAIQQAIDDMANGDAGISFVDFDREFRARRKSSFRKVHPHADQVGP